MNDLVTTQCNSLDTMLQENEKMRTAAAALMKTKHYQKLGEEGIYAVLLKAKSLNLDPISALNGDLYFVQGKVDMAAETMCQLIRQSGHSFTKDPQSNDEIIILHGKRGDNGDTWTESFSIQDAKTAGIYRSGGSWQKYPRDMMFARCLSRLAKRLFADVVKGCGVREDIPLVEEAEVVVYITDEQAEELNDWIADDDAYRKQVMDFIKEKFGAATLKEIPSNVYQSLLTSAKKNSEKREKENA